MFSFCSSSLKNIHSYSKYVKNISKYQESSYVNKAFVHNNREYNNRTRAQQALIFVQDIH